MPAALGISILMPSVAALWEKAAECKCSPVVRIIVVLGFVGFLPNWHAKCETGEGALAAPFKGEGKEAAGGKCSFSPFSKRKGREVPSMYVLSPFLKSAVGDQWDSCCFLRNGKLLGLLSLES